MFIGWLLGSAALHALALGVIPYVQLSDGLAGGDTMEVRLSPAGNALEPVIEGLGDANATTRRAITELSCGIKAALPN